VADDNGTQRARSHPVRIVGLITWRSADVNPVTVLVDALRALCLGGLTVTPVLQALAWIAGLLLATVPAAIRRYRHTTT
jgi:hypothetical protein